MFLYLLKQLNKLNKPVFCGQAIAWTFISRDGIRSPITKIKATVDLDKRGTNEQYLNTLLLPPPPPTTLINTSICSLFSFIQCCV